MLAPSSALDPHTSRASRRRSSRPSLSPLLDGPLGAADGCARVVAANRRRLSSAVGHAAARVLRNAARVTPDSVPESERNTHDLLRAARRWMLLRGAVNRACHRRRDGVREYILELLAALRSLQMDDRSGPQPFTDPHTARTTMVRSVAT